MNVETARLTSPGPSGWSCHHEFVSTERLRPEERFAFWRDICLTRCEPYGSPDAQSNPFTASFRYLVAPEGEFTDLCMSAAGITRTPSRCRADDIDNLALCMSLSGGGGGWFGDPDQVAALETGHLRIRDQARPYLVQFTGADNRTLHLEFPRTTFDRRTLNRVAAAAGTLMQPTGLVPMLLAEMRTFAEIAAHLDPAARAAGLRSVLDLATTMLRLEFGSVPPESEICEDGMLVAAQALICRRFGSPDLSPEEIARRLGCSRAHLYRLFARHGLTIAGYLREIRLQRARSALAAAGPRDTVGDIAFRSGFDNPVHFAHLFRIRFGMRPREVLRRT